MLTDGNVALTVFPMLATQNVNGLKERLQTKDGAWSILVPAEGWVISKLWYICLGTVGTQPGGKYAYCTTDIHRLSWQPRR